MNKQQFMEQIEALGVRPGDTLMVHSSLRAVGPVEGGGDTVLDAFLDYLSDGLLLLPTHTWGTIKGDPAVYDPSATPSCVGTLTNLARVRKNAVRSLHPTHSVAAFGKRAAEYAAGEEKADTPCPRWGCWGRLYDEKAKILFLGCPLTKNTYLHSVEEWHAIPHRLAEKTTRYYIRMPAGELRPVDLHCHYNEQCPDISRNYGKMEPAFLALGIGREGTIGQARSVLCEAVGAADLVGSLLGRNSDLFLDNAPIPTEWYVK